MRQYYMDIPFEDKREQHHSVRCRASDIKLLVKRPDAADIRADIAHDINLATERAKHQDGATTQRVVKRRY